MSQYAVKSADAVGPGVGFGVGSGVGAGVGSAIGVGTGVGSGVGVSARRQAYWAKKAYVQLSMVMLPKEPVPITLIRSAMPL
jgi:F0F1-type ATP synthase membrane subunit c/vacuolar-type H+-ATPase subunit K